MRGHKTYVCVSKIFAKLKRESVTKIFFFWQIQPLWVSEYYLTTLSIAKIRITASVTDGWVRSNGGMIQTGENRRIWRRDQPVPDLLCPPKIPHGPGLERWEVSDWTTEMRYRPQQHNGQHPSISRPYWTTKIQATATRRTASVNKQTELRDTKCNLCMTTYV